ncbi:MAG TPA: SpoIIE family protein phosphatase [Bryobacteraceae bacterium]|jgi:sigma-B regulation protein RsbU (phosphoserine phosphatase)
MRGVIRATRQHSVLIALLVVVIFMEAGYATATLRFLRPGDREARPPISFETASRIIDSGPYAGWAVVAIRGKPFSGMAQFDEAVAEMQAGQTLPLTLRQPDGTLRDVLVPLQAARPSKISAGDIAQMIALDLLVPLVCIGLGFTVAAIRPRDFLAWLLLGLLLCFSEQVHVLRWNWPGREFAFLWHVTLAGLWSIWMMLFGIFFPGPSELEKKRPWLKWLVIVPILALQLGASAVMMLWNRNIDAALWWRPLLLRAVLPRLVLQIVATSWFFASLGTKTGKATSPDARRRLAILYTGATISLTPLFLIVLYGLARGREVFEGVATPLRLGSLLLLPLFPFTLAYVIVVHRALDVSVVVRQSVKYTLARGGLWALRIIALVWAAYAISNAFNSNARAVDRVRAGASAMLVLALQRRFTGRIAGWIDRRFFREAYNTEVVLSELSKKVRGFTETQPLLETVTRQIAETLHVLNAAVLINTGTEYCLAESVGFSGRENQCLPAQARTIEYLKQTNRASEVFFDDERSWIQETPEAERKRLQAMDAQVLLPLSGRDDLAGVMVLGPKRSEERYSAADLRLLEAVAAQTGLALENSRLVAALAEEAAQRERQRREMEIAKEVQERLFPQVFPAIHGTDYAGFCRPALGVGGDYYDFLKLANGNFGIAIGDVSGKGISAALLMASLQASLRGQTLAGLDDLSALMLNVNRLVYDASASNRYATFFYGEYSPESRRLRYVNAGHNPPMILRGREVLRLEASGPVVGLLKNATYEQAEFDLRHTDVLVGFTDGISEALTVEEEEWGEERLIDAVRESMTSPPGK